MAVTLSSKNVGDIVKIAESGVLTNYIIVHKGAPEGSDYAAEYFTDTVMLQRQDCLGEQPWNYDVSSYYKTSHIKSWLENSFAGTIDSAIRDKLVYVYMPYTEWNASYNSYSKYIGYNGAYGRVFLLSATEAGTSTSDGFVQGSTLEYYKTDAYSKRIAKYNGSAVPWWLRTISSLGTYKYGAVWCVNESGGINAFNVSSVVKKYVRPAFVLPGSLYILDSGAVTASTPPTAPSSITVPADIKGGTTITISWGASSNAAGDAITYIAQRSIDNGTSWLQIYSGANRSYNHAIPLNWSDTVIYRVQATISAGLTSAWTTAPKRTIDNTVAPAIASGTSGNIGTKSADFSWTYTVSQADSETTAVTETIDGVQLRNYTAALGTTNTFSVTGMTFLKLLNGAHTMKVTAAAANGKSAEHTVTFTKGAYTCTVTLSAPLSPAPPSELITKMVMGVTSQFPADVVYKVLVTNNARDTAPVWEDATNAVQIGRNYLFTNKTVKSGDAFNFKITASRGASGVGGWISSIGGAFE